MPPPTARLPISASLVVCESVLREATGGLSVIRIMDVLHCGRTSPFARFHVVTYLHSDKGDFDHHSVKVQMVAESGGVVASAPDQSFLYGYKIDPYGYGAFALTTEFTLDLTKMGQLGRYFIQALLDGSVVAATPFMLRRLD